MIVRTQALRRAFRLEGSRRQAAEPVALARQVRLVGIAGGHRRAGQIGVPVGSFDQDEERLESENPVKDLGSLSDRLQAPTPQVARGTGADQTPGRSRAGRATAAAA